MERSGLTTQEDIEKMLNDLNNVKNNKKALKKEKNKILSTIIFIITIFILSISLLSIVSSRAKGEIPSILGFSILKVQSGSMEPTLMTGDYIVIKNKKNYDNLKTGTIITFKMLDGKVVTHRIIEKETDEKGKIFYTTKGDNKINTPDNEKVTSDRIIGVFLTNLG